MSTETNRAVVQRYFNEVWNEGQLDVLGEVVAADVVLHANGRPPEVGIDRWRRGMQRFRSAFPDVTIATDELIADGDRVVVRATIRGTHRGPLMGVAPTGTAVIVTALVVLRLTDGKIAEEWEVADLLGLLQQLGATMAPPVPPPA